MNQKRKNIVFIVFIHYRTWFRYTRRPHFAELAKFGKLYIVENPLVIVSSEFLKEPIKTLKHYFNYSKGLRKDERSGALVYRPILLFSINLKKTKNIFKIIDQYLLKVQLGRIESNNSIRICFITNVLNNWFITNDKDTFWGLDINDDWSLMPYNKEREQEILNSAKELIKRMDFAIAVTKKLTNKFNVDNKVFFIPNAVDTNHYVPSFDELSKKIEEGKVHKIFGDISFLKKEENDQRKYLTSLDAMKDMKKPVVGSYSGLSGNWSDFAFISEVEKLLPINYSMVSSGVIHPPTVPDYVEEYKKYIETQRMTYLGYVDYSILPEFLSGLNVALVMHRMDEFNTHSAPNKIWAYLAMGLPVVSTDFLTEPDKEIYEGLVTFCKTPLEYVDAIINSYINDNMILRKQRRALAIKYSTENRASTIVNNLIEKFAL